MDARVVVEKCQRLNPHRDLFRTHRVKFDGVTEGTWKGLRCRSGSGWKMKAA
jgi:hypothetical protein